jgi:DNA-binding PucR family transcriptional regulator
LVRSYREADSALRVGQSLRASGSVESQVHDFSALGVQRLLFTLRQESPGILRDFEDSVIGAVVAYDKDHGTELIHTLKTYMECDGNINQVAEFLHVHKHTVRYRLRRVTELTGLDVTRFRDAAQLYLAVQAAGLL